MLWNEFMEGTDCKDNDYNYNVYKELEIIYMATECSKQHIYEMGRKLVDNSKSAKELALEAQIKEEIAQLKDEISAQRSWISYWESLKVISSKDQRKECNRNIRIHKNEIGRKQARIEALKWVLA